MIENDVDRRSTLSGMNDGEAREFNRLFVMSFLIFTAVAIVAHVLAWMWRPWLPSASGYKTGALIDGSAAVASLIDGATAVGTHMIHLLG